MVGIETALRRMGPGPLLGDSHEDDASDDAVTAQNPVSADASPGETSEWIPSPH